MKTLKLTAKWIGLALLTALVLSGCFPGWMAWSVIDGMSDDVNDDE